METLSLLRTDEKIQDKDKQKIRFQKDVNSVLKTPLTIGNIDSYAESALTDLVNITDRVLEGYKRYHPFDTNAGKELEDTAFTYFGLSNLNQTLDHIAAKSKELTHLSEVIEGAENIGKVIVVPNDRKPLVTNGGVEKFRPKEVIARTKTLLFILANDFDVKVDNPNQLTLKTGILTDRMMRKLSYYLITVPRIDRTMLVCDEEGNVTYIFDNQALEKDNISPSDLTRLTKEEINILLLADPSLGRRVVYSSNFVPRMVGLIKDINAQEKTTPQSNEPTSSYLYPKAQEGYMSIKSIAKELGTHDTTLKKLIDSIDPEEMGLTSEMRFGSNTTTGYSPEQIALIKSRYVRIPEAQEGYMPIGAIAKEMGIAGETLKRLIDSINPEEMGTTSEMRFGSKTTTGYSPDQIALIKSRYVRIPEAQEGYMSINAIGKKMGIADKTVKKIIDSINPEEMGTTSEMRFGINTTTGYSPDQIALIKSRYVRIPEAQEGYMSINAIANEMGIAEQTVKKIIDSIDPEEMGLTSEMSFANKTTTGYSPDQIALIKSRYGRVPKAQEGYMSINAIGKEMGIAEQTVKKIIDSINPEEMGTTSEMRFGINTTTGYSPEQIALIKSRYVRVPEAQEGYMSIKTIGKELGIDDKTVKKIIDSINPEEMGTTSEMRFGSNTTTGYSPEQIALIKSKVLNRK